MHYVEDRVMETLWSETYQVVVDLGCGVGGSLRYLYPKYQARYIGITISGFQAELARRLLASSASDTQIVHANMLDVAHIVASTTTRIRPIPERKLFFAIESLIHLKSPDAMFSILGGVCQKGDSLIIADDTLTRLPSRAEAMLTRRFVDGWHAPGLNLKATLIRSATSFGFNLTHESNLTPYLELQRPRDRLLRLALPLLRRVGRRSSWVESMNGGDALQRGLLTGLIEYSLMCFERI